MGADAILSIITAVLSAAATYAPPLYRAIVGDGRTLDQVLAEARAAVDAIPAAPAASSIDAAIAARLRSQPSLVADIAELESLRHTAVLSHAQRAALTRVLAAGVAR